MDFETVLISTVRISLPLVMAALGGLFSERSGTAQIALEAYLLMGALSGASVAALTGSPWLGLVAAGISGLIFASLMAFLTLVLRAEHIVCGVALNLLAFGLAPTLTKLLFDSTGSTPALSISSRFVFAPYWMTLVFILFTCFVFYFSRFGVMLKFAGSLPSALTSNGVSATKIRFLGLLFCGLTTAVGGSFLSIFLSSSYSPMMSAGRGFIALSAIIFARWSPLPVLIICLIFAGFEATANFLQGSSTFIPATLIQLVPYFLTIAALIFFRTQSKAPTFLGRSLE